MLRKTFGFGSLLLAGVLAAGCEKKEKIVDIDTTGPRGNGVSVDVDRSPSTGQVEVEVKKN